MPLETRSRVEAILDRLQGSYREISTPISTRAAPDRSAHGAFLALSADDMTSVMKALYPQRRPASLSSDADPSRSGLQSSASSISGFSLFQSTEITDSLAGIPRPWPPDFHRSAAAEPEKQSESEAEAGGDAVTWPPTLRPPSDDDHIREACIALEDLTNSTLGRTDHWTVLTIDSNTGELSSGRDISDEPSRLWEQHASGQHTDTYLTCKAVVGSLLAVSHGFGSDTASHDRLDSHEEVFDAYRNLERAMQRQIEDAQDTADFMKAHLWFEHLCDFQTVLAHGSESDILGRTLIDLEDQAHWELACDEVRSTNHEAWLRLANPCLEDCHAQLRKAAKVLSNLRDKMWYVADVRTSAPYDEARSIAGALKVMGRPRRPARTRVAPPLRHWSGSKIATASLHLKTEAQILDLLGATPEQGGPNKLSDDQVNATAAWIERESIENVCWGEERIHRLCMEIRKCIGQLTSPDSTLLASNPLFAQDQLQRPSSAGPLTTLQRVTGHLNSLTFPAGVASSIDSVSAASHPLSSASSRDYIESRSPTLTHKSSAPFWSPATSTLR